MNLVRCILFTIAIISFSAAETVAQSYEWTWRNPLPTGVSLNGIAHTGGNNYTVAGDFGTILQSADGGETWVHRQSGTLQNLGALYFSGANTGTAVGASGTILRTVDGGQTWTPQTSNTSAFLTAVHFTDDNTGTVAGTNGVIRRTVDGGETWSAQPAGVNVTFRSVFFHDAQNGFVTGNSGTILRTENGGQTWNPVESGITSTLSDIYFVDENYGFIAASGGQLLKTSDGGLNWAVQSFGVSAWFKSVRFFNDKSGILAGEFGLMYKTTDGGQNWVSQSSGIMRSMLESIHMLGPDEAVIVGDAGTIMRSTDGQTWQNQKQGSMATLHDVSFVSEKAGFAAGTTGAVLRTTDGGMTWQELPERRTADAIFFTDELTGTAVSGSNIFRTTDGGESWQLQNSGVTTNLWDVYFTSVNIGYVSGSSGVILKTTDAGENWTQQESGVTVVLNGISFFGSQIGTAVGSSGTIVHTRDGGETWTVQPTGRTNILRGVHQIDENRASVSGSTIVLRTNDGGENWTVQNTGANVALHDISFATPDRGIVVGHQQIYMTEDGGETWTRAEARSLRDYRGVTWVNGNTAVVVGDGGKIKTAMTQADEEPLWVWPGDTNNDGTVTAADVLPILFWYNESGPVRREVFVPVWEAQEAQPWPQVMSTYADATGNGTIDAGDIDVVTGSFGSTRIPGNENPLAPGDPVIDFTIGPGSSGTVYRIRLDIGSETNPVVAFRGLAAHLHYPNELVMVAGINPGDLLGTVDLQTFEITVDDPEMTGFALGRTTAGSGQPAFGSAAELVLVLQQNTTETVPVILSDIWTIADGRFEIADISLVSVTSTSATDEPTRSLPVSYSLNQNYPNPFNPVTNVRYELPVDSPVRLEVFDLLGRRVALLYDGMQTAGRHAAAFDASRLASGVYIYRIQTPGFTQTRKMMLVK
jgi:photosystem II stability/assembly factor-like uncharacterized protein